MKISAQAAFNAKSPLQPHTVEWNSPAPKEVEIKITHCGLCRSDIHLIDNDWQINKYPLVPGHEIIGSVATLGKGVEHLKVGQRVGVGWLAASCLECEWCLQGDETSCLKQRPTCVGRPGGFAERIVVDSRWAFPIPEGLSDAGTAPLLCGGITVYTPLSENATTGSRVGIIGMGGLGHLAIKFARAMGCEVTAFSTSPNKSEVIHSLGAHFFFDSRDEGALKKRAGSLDVLLSTIMVDQNWEGWLKLLRPRGTLVFVGASPGPVNVQAASLMMGKKSVKGSVTGGRNKIREMLGFAARHQIQAQVETLPLSEVNTAIEKLRSNQAQFRMVLKVES